MREQGARRTEKGLAQGKPRRPKEAGPRRRRIGWPALSRGLGYVLFAVAVALIIASGRPPIEAELGEASPRDYVARVDFTSLDVQATRAARQKARLGAPPVFTLDRGPLEQSVGRLQDALARGGQSPLWAQLPAEDRQRLLPLVPRLQGSLPELEGALQRLSGMHLAARDDLENPLVRQTQGREALLIGPAGGEDRIPLEQIAALDADGPALRQTLAPALEGLSSAEAALALRCFARLLPPNVDIDVERTREAAERAAAAEPNRLKRWKTGSIILARGTEVERQHVEALARERETYWSGPAGTAVYLQRAGGIAVLLLIIMAGTAIYIARYRPELFHRRAQMASFVLLTLALVAMARTCVIWGVTPLWVPVPMMVMIMCLVYDQRFGLGVAVFYALLVRLACPGADFELLVLLLGGLMAALLTAKVRTRSTLIKAGLLAGLTQLCAAWGLGLMSVMDGQSIPLEFWRSALFGRSLVALGNGVMSGFIVSGLLPAIERLFGVTTDIRLLEWSDPNQPLLQQMLLDAPGSYHHSMIVGSLAADAAEAIGASPLLARVSAYFHDVGKLKKPRYYGENLPEAARNPHDDLTPTMSSLIITAHPKDGAEMAERYGVPKVVREIILQSHGSSLLQYFWSKAQQDGERRDELKQSSFRYHLPKPASKEAAVVMLCDAVESAARSLEAPSVGQLRNLVHGVVHDRLDDGQLDNSGLTITDLKTVEDVLVHGLTAVFHSRVSYPGQENLTEGDAEGPRAAAARPGADSTDAG